MNGLKDFALALAEQGWPVVSQTYDGEYLDWLYASTDPEEVRAMFAGRRRDLRVLIGIPRHHFAIVSNAWLQDAAPDDVNWDTLTVHHGDAEESFTAFYRVPLGARLTIAERPYGLLIADWCTQNFYPATGPGVRWTGEAVLPLPESVFDAVHLPPKGRRGVYA